MKKHRSLSLLALAAAPLLAACEPTVASRGNMLDPVEVARVKPGVSTREQVAAMLGTPTRVSAFDEKVWYYIGRQTEQYSFFSPEVIKQQAVQVSFDERGVVTDVRDLDVSGAQDVDTVSRETPTFGRKDSLIRELLGDINHPMPSLKNGSRSGD